MPPEQLGGTVSPSSDLYALGASIVHLLSRKEPSQLLNTQLELAIDSGIHASSEMKHFLRQLTAREPENRFQSAEEALNAVAENVVDRSAPPRVTANLVMPVWLELERQIRRGVNRGGMVAALIAGTLFSLTIWLMTLLTDQVETTALILAAAVGTVFWGVKGRAEAVTSGLNDLNDWAARMLPGQPEAQDELKARAHLADEVAPSWTLSTASHRAQRRRGQDRGAAKARRGS